MSLSNLASSNTLLVGTTCSIYLQTRFNKRRLLSGQNQNFPGDRHFTIGGGENGQSPIGYCCESK